MEIVSGRSNTSYRPKENSFFFLIRPMFYKRREDCLNSFDPSLGSNYSKEEAMQMLNLAIICTNLSPTLRPTMSTVVSMLDGKMPVRVPTTESRDSKSHGSENQVL
ncbi:probable LRR receptor-like serine/threonine-protein kinase At1g53430 [Phoenix dactylifera]|uniref:Probable LRR receptor-like serine/threonine-protein kinase At1g53430 n=1 Tax=Phoenix dactylifera TaxID=42345 RepID=A0A8B9A3Z7_PHODC|nr:probable LRR receptor-like serine/threonine-protein kinase At1g53430 [Phoenix dactylifera]